MPSADCRAYRSRVLLEGTKTMKISNHYKSNTKRYAKSFSLTLILSLISLPVWAQNNTQGITFSKDIMPILQDNCQECHRPQGQGPMSFMTYEEVRPWAPLILSLIHI